MGLRTGLSHLRSTRRRTLLLAASIRLASPARRDKIANANQPPRPIRGQPVEAPHLAVAKNDRRLLPRKTGDAGHGWCRWALTCAIVSNRGSDASWAIY